MFLPINDSKYDLIIAPSSYHQFLLQSREKGFFPNFKIISKEMLLEGLFFKVKEEAIFEVCKMEKCSFENAKIYISNLFFLPKEFGKEKQINFLINIRNYLDKKDLLEKNPYFRREISNRNALVFGYGKDVEIQKAAEEFKITLNYPETPNVQKGFEVFQFPTIEAEVHYVFNQIAHTIQESSSLDDIYIYNPGSAYRYVLERASRYFNIPINFLSFQTLEVTPIGIEAIRFLSKKPNISLLKDHLTEIFGPLKNSPILNVINKMETLSKDYGANKEYLSYLLKQIKVPSVKYKNAIQILSSPVPTNFGIVFILGFTQGSIPKVYKDTDFLSDRIKTILNMETSLTANQKSSEEIIQFLFNTPKVILTYSKISLDNETFISPLASILKMKEIINPTSKVEYGNLFGELYLADLMDTKRIYGISNPIETIYQNKFKIPYRTYRHEFSSVVTGEEKSNLVFSYSRLKSFYSCQFRYYLDYVIKIDPFDGTFFSFFGSFAHSVLQDSNSEKFDFLISVNKHLTEYPFTTKDKVLMKNLIIDLEKVVIFNRLHQENMALEKIYTEVKSSFQIDEITSFYGIVDKVIVTKIGDKKLVSLVDYKTGVENFDSSLIEYGVSLQLPTYSLLLSKNPQFENYELVGFYIQNIIPKKRHYLPGTIEEKKYFDQLKLNGLTLNDIPKLATLDSNYKSSPFLSSISITQKGQLNARAKTATSDEFENYKEKSQEKINQALQEIRKSNFVINPHSIVGKDYSCEYCNFNDVCFRPDSAVKVIKIKKDESEDILDE